METETIKKEVTDQFYQLVSALNKSDLEAWSEHYSKEQFLSAIVSTDYYAGRSAWLSVIAGYFSTRESQQIEPDAVRVSALTSDLALLTSEEKTRISLKHGQNIEAKHVFTMIWKREQDGWKILHSHESWLDEPASAAAVANPVQPESAGEAGTLSKVFVGAKSFVLFSCPKCNKTTKEQTGPYKGAKGPVNISCPCGHKYDVVIEFRRGIRKIARIDGIYFSAADASVWGKMFVKNISLHGCGFETLKTNPFHPDDEIKIEFQLDDARQSLIKKIALVRSVDKKYVGCQFVEEAGGFDPELGFYLRKL